MYNSLNTPITLHVYDEFGIFNVIDMEDIDWNNTGQ